MTRLKQHVKSPRRRTKAHSRAAIIHLYISHPDGPVDVSSNRRSYRAKLLSAALTYNCTLARARLLQKAGAYNGTDQRSLRPKLIRLVYYARKIAQFKYVCKRVGVQACASPNADKEACFRRRKLFAYYIREFSKILDVPGIRTQ